MAGIIALVAVVAILAVVAENNSQAERARSFDGWVGVAPNHVLHLFYAGSLERTVPLSQLRREDTFGLEYAILREEDGTVLLRPAL